MASNHFFGRSIHRIAAAHDGNRPSTELIEAVLDHIVKLDKLILSPQLLSAEVDDERTDAALEVTR